MATSPPPPEPQTRKPVWTYGLSDHIEELPADRLKDFKATGNFAVDFAALSTKCGVVTHPGFVPPAPPAGKVRVKSPQDPAEVEVPNPGSMLSLQSILVGRASMLVFRQVISTSLHVEVLRLTGCCLDVECVALLRAGLTESCSVGVLQLDWNPVEVPVDAVALKTAFENGEMEEIDSLEKNREQRQVDRTLRAFGELLTTRFGDVPSGMKALQRNAVRDRMHHEATAGVEPFALSVWGDAFHNVLNIGTAESEQIFNFTDKDGTGDGLATFDSLELILQNLEPISQEDEAADPIGKAFGSFVDGTSPLDVVSFRHCNLGRLECVGIGKALTQSTHIRAINLWGNKICDLAATALAESFEIYYGLQFLGLGRNLITNVGLEKLCEPLGFSRIEDKAQADQIQKDIKEKSKEKDKKKGAGGARKDVHGNDRYVPELNVPTCDQQTDEAGEYWLWGRNRTLYTLNLEYNPITDAAAVMKLQPMGVGDLHLKGVPCAEKLSTLFAEVESARGKTPEAKAVDGEEVTKSSPEPPAEEDAGQRRKGWTLLFR